MSLQRLVYEDSQHLLYTARCPNVESGQHGQQECDCLQALRWRYRCSARASMITGRNQLKK